jgi:hypothetical protein
MPDGAVLIALGLWLYFVGYKWGRLGAHAARHPIARNVVDRELDLRHGKMGRVAPFMKVAGGVLLAIGAVGVIGYVTSSL